jgi:hypothetical protein
VYCAAFLGQADRRAPGSLRVLVFITERCKVEVDIENRKTMAVVEISQGAEAASDGVRAFKMNTISLNF